jgi:hypothetical protein
VSFRYSDDCPKRGSCLASTIVSIRIRAPRGLNNMKCESSIWFLMPFLASSSNRATRGLCSTHPHSTPDPLWRPGKPTFACTEQGICVWANGRPCGIHFAEFCFCSETLVFVFCLSFYLHNSEVATMQGCSTTAAGMYCKIIRGT